VLAAQDAGNVARPVSRLTLELDGASGVERIRLDVRGTQLDAGFATSSTAAADRLAAGVHDLRAALERRGLTADTVQISGARPDARLDARLEVRDGTASADRAAEARLAPLGLSGAGDAGGLSQGGAQSQQQQSREPFPRDTTRDTTRDASAYAQRDERSARDDRQSADRERQRDQQRAQYDDATRAPARPRARSARD
jgi:hypothetical protein